MPRLTLVNFTRGGCHSGLVRQGVPVGRFHVHDFDALIGSKVVPATIYARNDLHAPVRSYQLGLDPGPVPSMTSVWSDGIAGLVDVSPLFLPASQDQKTKVSTVLLLSIRSSRQGAYMLTLSVRRNRE